MANTDLSQNESYEWYGTFWFPTEHGENLEKLSGKLSYTSEDGIRLSLSDNEYNKISVREPITKRIMHGLVHGSNSMHLTLYNVFLNTGGSFGNPTIRILKGSAEYLIPDVFLENCDVLGMAYEYDDHLNNFFMRFKEQEGFKLSQASPISISENLTLSSENPFSGTSIDIAEDIESVFHAMDETVLIDLKEAIEPIIEKNKYSILLKKKQSVSFAFKAKEGNISIFEIAKYEQKWREYIEILIDHLITIKNIQIIVAHVTEKGEAYNSSYNCLKSVHYSRKPRYNDPQHLLHLKISILSFKNKRTQEFANIEQSFLTWLSNSEKPEWQPIMNGLRRAFKSDEELVDTSAFTALVSDIETFLDIMGFDHKTANVDGLISMYADSDWKEECNRLAKETRKTDTLGQWMAHIRNVITHPKTCKKKHNGRYWGIATNNILLQEIYAHLSSLFLYAILKDTSDIDEKNLREFCKDFKSHRCFYNVEYSD